MSSRLRLLEIGPLPPPWSGIGVSLQHLVASAPLRSQQTWVLDTSPRALPGNPGRPKLPTPRRSVRHARLAGRVAGLVRRHRIDVVHLHGSSHDLSLFGNALSVLAARLTGARTVWQLHEDLSVVPFPGRKPLNQALFSTLMRVPDALALLSTKDWALASKYLPPQRLAVVPPTCSPDLAELPLRRRGGVLSVLYVGWLTRAKGIYDLLQVALALRDSSPRVTFYVLGTGMTDQETAAVHAFVARHRLETEVRLCGVVTGDAKRALFASAHLLFLPTHWDAFPVTVLEAMAAGLPVLATRVGGVPLMVKEGCGGLLTEVGDVARMAELLRQLSTDEERRGAMGRANRRRFLAQYHPDAVGGVALDLYRRLVGVAGGHG